MKKIKITIILQILMLIYSLGSIASKLASKEVFLSSKYIYYMSLLYLSLAIFAITWQQILKKISLSIAYVNKATTMIWTLLISVFVFNERITIANIIGTLIIVIGIIIVSLDSEKNE